MQKSRTTRETGNVGEQAVADFLVHNGYSILERNFTVRGGEIDIIAFKNGRLVFVEVKTRSPGALVSGERAVTKSKRGFLVRAAEIYYRRYKKEHGEALCRFDVASAVIENGRIISVKYYVNAFDAGT